PLAAATDAHVIDTTELDADTVLDTACRLVRSSPRTSRRKVRAISGELSDTALKVRNQESP
ncbi:MAG: hypothetical protein OXH60_10365, partial [Rhodospirillales bacterium]|nr:hypothetical protein [Rhodospirillales bacterium]